MNYLVMEMHPAYAVVLDEEGRFLKAANLHYQVGDTVQDIVELRQAAGKSPALWKPLSGVAGLAACLCLVFFGYYQPNFTPYGALRIQINPDVELTLSRTDRVLELEGLNEDGQVLIEGYDYRRQGPGGRDRRAGGAGHRHGLPLRRGDGVHHGHQRRRRLAGPGGAGRPGPHLEERYGETIVIQLGDGAADQSQSAAAPEEPAEVVVPVTPQSPDRPRGRQRTPPPGPAGRRTQTTAPARMG